MRRRCFSRSVGAMLASFFRGTAAFGFELQPKSPSRASEQPSGLVERVKRLEQDVVELKQLREQLGPRTIVHFGQQAGIKVRLRDRADKWTSPKLELPVRAGDLIRVSVNFDALPYRARGLGPGFYWNVTCGGATTPLSNPVRVFENEANEGGWHSQSTTALYRAGADGPLPFGIKFSPGHLSGHLDIFGLLIVAESLGKR